MLASPSALTRSLVIGTLLLGTLGCRSRGETWSLLPSRGDLAQKDDLGSDAARPFNEGLSPVPPTRTSEPPLVPPLPDAQTAQAPDFEGWRRSSDEDLADRDRSPGLLFPSSVKSIYARWTSRD